MFLKCRKQIANKQTIWDPATTGALNNAARKSVESSCNLVTTSTYQEITFWLSQCLYTPGKLFSKIMGEWYYIVAKLYINLALKKLSLYWRLFGCMWIIIKSVDVIWNLLLCSKHHAFLLLGCICFKIFSTQYSIILTPIFCAIVSIIFDII